MKKLLIVFLSLILTANLLATNKISALSDSSYVVINADTGKILKGSNYNTKLPMASTTKIMTALILAEQQNLNKIVTVKQEMLKVEGSAMGLKAGDKVSYSSLLYGMMLSSGNDAANVTAYSIGGSLKKFAKIMNNKAKSLGLYNTNFVTPSGLHNDNHYTTAYDLALLTKYALDNKHFKKACSTYKAVVYFGNPLTRYTLTNHNRLLLNVNGCIGVKTGFTKKAGRCLVSACEKDGKRIICVTLNDSNDWQNHKEFLDFGLNSTISYTPKAPKENNYVNVIGGNKREVKVNLNLKPITLTKQELKEFKLKVHIPKFVYSPINKTQKIGEASYFVNNTKVKSFNITSYSFVKNKSIAFYDVFLNNLKLLFIN